MYNREDQGWKSSDGLYHTKRTYIHCTKIDRSLEPPPASGVTVDTNIIQALLRFLIPYLFARFTPLSYRQCQLNLCLRSLPHLYFSIPPLPYLCTICLSITAFTMPNPCLSLSLSRFLVNNPPVVFILPRRKIPLPACLPIHKSSMKKISTHQPRVYQPTNQPPPHLDTVHAMQNSPPVRARGKSKRKL